MTFQERVTKELEEATEKFGPFNSPHEGYAVLLEEVEELWAWVKLKGDNKESLRGSALKECIQIAAMAQRFARDVLGER